MKSSAGKKNIYNILTKKGFFYYLGDNYYIYSYMKKKMIYTQSMLKINNALLTET